MNLSSLNQSNRKNKKKRLGRGQGSGKGGTSTRGHKGAKSRSGNSRKLGFEGGQMPLHRRIPKVGFKKTSRKKSPVINIDFLQSLVYQGIIKEGKNVSKNVLFDYGIIGKNDLIKILGRGELNVRLTILAHKFSHKAGTAIKRSGGKIITMGNSV
jgi:large subunit ribosomal protein L15